MIEDKLELDQRIRLECLAQANMTERSPSWTQTLMIAGKYEDYVRNGLKEETNA